MKQIKYKSGIIILFNIILFIAMYVGIALLRYKTVINTGIGAGISGNAIDNISDINEIKNSFIVLIVLILVNIWNILDHWVEVRRENISIRRMCGAKNWDIIILVARQSLLLLLVSFTIATLICAGLKNVDFFFSEYIVFTDKSILLFIVGVIFIEELVLLIKFVIPEFKYWIQVRYILFFIQMIVVSVLTILVVDISLNYLDFVNKFNSVEEDLSTVSYARQINGDEFASNPPDEFEDVNLFIDEITDGQYYSFGESSVELSYDKSLKGLEEFSDGGSYFYSALYITDKFSEVYKWEMFEGTMFDDEEYKHISEKYIPIVVGYNYRKSYSVGDVMDNTYIIKGILEKNQFYLNPKWQGKVYYTDNIIIMPMVYSLEEWGGDIVNQLHILKSDKEIEQEIQEEIKRFNMPLIEFRSMNEQIGYIKKDVANYVRYYGCSMIIILCVSCISYISMLVLLVDIKRKEYAIKIMCGASKVNIFIEMAGPIFGAILFANIISAIILGQIRLLGYLVIFSIVLAFVILIAPSVKLFRMTLAESINK